MVIKSNIPALNAQRNLGINNKSLSKNLEKLSSGYQINRAADNAAGLGISEKMRSQIRGLEMAEQNTENAIQLIQTAEGGLNEIHAILHRMRELAVQSSNGTYTQEDREHLSLEFETIKGEITRIADSTHYNGIKLLNGELDGNRCYPDISSSMAVDPSRVFYSAYLGEDVPFGTEYEVSITLDGTGEELAIEITADGASVISGPLSLDDFVYEQYSNIYMIQTDDGSWISLSAGALENVLEQLQDADPLDPDAMTSYEFPFTAELGDNLIFQIGANGGQDQTVTLGVRDMSAIALGLQPLTVIDRDLANYAIDIIDDAVNSVSAQRAQLGALQNRLEHTINGLNIAAENLSAAESTIRDTDMAEEMMKFTQNSILVQASQAMLAQANALPQGLLSLLG